MSSPTISILQFNGLSYTVRAIRTSCYRVKMEQQVRTLSIRPSVQYLACDRENDLNTIRHLTKFNSLTLLPQDNENLEVPISMRDTKTEPIMTLGRRKLMNRRGRKIKQKTRFPSAALGQYTNRTNCLRVISAPLVQFRPVPLPTESRR